ncbi:hypothetical protein WN944_001655 [Citrus x changshan-huyou]|uniref:Uncharacterized protein n=1 Tax=Citrus x changshan-huyou TaxID=2935761 RepID=A0AAP0QRL2_9ROSI
MILLIRSFHSHSSEPTSSGPSPLSTPKSAGGPAISSQPKTTWPPPSHVNPPSSSLGRARPLVEYWWCTEKALDWGPGGSPDLIIDDGGTPRCLSTRESKLRRCTRRPGSYPTWPPPTTPSFILVVPDARKWNPLVPCHQCQ